jgi:hypothetical protein
MLNDHGGRTFSPFFQKPWLMEQLRYEGFTQAQASYGVSVAY